MWVEGDIDNFPEMQLLSLCHIQLQFSGIYFSSTPSQDGCMNGWLDGFQRTDNAIHNCNVLLQICSAIHET